MSDEFNTLQTVAERLDQAHLLYMITGSVAMSFYAMPRMTRDIDIVIELRRDDALRLADIFKKDFYVDMEMISEAIRDVGMFNMIHDQTGVKIDFVVRKSERYRKIEFDRRRKIVVQGRELWLVSQEDLILSKLCWAKDSQSEIQLRDVKNLLNDPGSLDLNYLGMWAKELDIDQMYAKALT